jgi:hypothetical protein
VLRRFFIEFSKCDIKQVCWVRGKKGWEVQILGSRSTPL